MAEGLTVGEDHNVAHWTVPCWACGEEMQPGLSWHRDHDARSPLERAIDEDLGIDSAQRDRQMLRYWWTGDAPEHGDRG